MARIKVFIDLQSYRAVRQHKGKGDRKEQEKHTETQTVETEQEDDQLCYQQSHCHTARGHSTAQQPRMETNPAFPEQIHVQKEKSTEH